MPRIYELPAGSANPKQMMANKMDMELNGVTQWFDTQTGLLDQQQMEPDQYKTAYAKLQRQAMNQRVATQAKHEAAAQQIKNMQKLVESGMLSPEQMQSTMLVMAGVPIEHVRKMFAQAQRQKPSTRLNELNSMGKKLVGFRQQFEDHRQDYFGYKGVYYTDPTGKKRKATETEVQAFDATATQVAALDREKQQIFATLTPLEQYSVAGSRAVERFGMGREHRGGGAFGGGIRMAEPAPKKQSTAAELRKAGTHEAYEQGKKLGYWE
ncbi:hypothetical protein LCGC14_2058190 [marine sediment metagenome]|uniref:Uncharacterized protein n=1 Tax=marine sediment metagenome TaxID=412755 RepID=A0A0F9ELV1_9ZZZZ